MHYEKLLLNCQYTFSSTFDTKAGVQLLRGKNGHGTVIFCSGAFLRLPENVSEGAHDHNLLLGTLRTGFDVCMTQYSEKKKQNLDILVTSFDAQEFNSAADAQANFAVELPGMVPLLECPS